MADGKTVLLSFFQTDCGTCILEAPVIDSIYIQFGSGEEELLVWGIVSPYDGLTEIEEFIVNTEITYPCFPTGHAEDVFAYYDISYTPQVYIVCDYMVSESIPFFQIVENLDYCFPTEIKNIDISPDVYSNFEQLYINNPYGEPVIVSIYDITGRQINRININPQQEQIIDNLKPNNIYIVNILSESGVLTNKKVLIK
ncbi:MAG: hypothetical protein C0596_04980 [Marinilabiliales bacterium]|nr:MAG: hypothetical protein C0596_04980 [Marinilabiliales bacterium]